MPETQSEQGRGEADLLRAARGRIKATMSKVFTFLKKFELNKNKKLELTLRIKAIEPLLGEFNKIQFDLEILFDSGDDEEERERFEQQYYSFMASSIELLNQTEPVTEVNLQSPIESRTIQVAVAASEQNLQSKIISPTEAIFNNNIGALVVSGVHLPNLSLLKFNSDYEKWTQFYGSFQTPVDNNHCLDKIQKFFHLLGCLEGTPGW